MGYGDFKLTAALGAWLGWKMLPLIVLISSGLGALVGISAIILGLKSRNSQLPFGPFLAISGWLAMICGDSILLWYTSMFNDF
jgi:leader peptidase (prepilin peptidase)/N-methyltransferase